MGIRLKKGVDPEVLRDYGFKSGKEWADSGEPCISGIGYEYKQKGYHKYMMDEEEPERIYYAEDEIPMVGIWVKENGEFYVDCAPCCTYHIGGDELDTVTDTICDLAIAGIIEVYKE